ncbi:phosphate butyryltransferase [Fictibacillus phosphorivorans]|uniref:phosphate butyryltransferase n=1 Tax=Fictibacillus phosphorivorans TaxID=1221500 RepID=UPI00203FA38E|nr:phosphate butyryltransferase [Fictibacillus phosphorivorans]MCM3716740.1 phosphate butyryltransferase [Fictibacillus phosphorivorans]MCM3774711.1 phosphate butyryltransferase [Fictibacillus phosphorivorans]
MLLEDLVSQAKNQQVKPVIAVAEAGDQEVMESVLRAYKEGIAHFILFGNAVFISDWLEKNTRDSTTGIEIVSSQTAAIDAVKAVHSGKADILMKGLVSTSVLLKAVLNKECGLRTGKVLSHVAAFEVSGYDRLIFVTDAAMNIHPDLNQKSQILQNAIDFVQQTGVAQPKTAVLAAVENVNPAMQATLDAANLTVMNLRNQITGGIVEGPLALDNAVSTEAAAHKGIKGEVAGKADILLVPTIETGNILYKSLIYFARAKVGAVICGAKAPIVLTSRADSSESKYLSIALAVKSVITDKKL